MSSKTWKPENNITFLISIHMDSSSSYSINRTKPCLRWVCFKFGPFPYYIVLLLFSWSLRFFFLIFCSIIKFSQFPKFSRYSLPYKFPYHPWKRCQGIFRSSPCLSSPVGTNFSLVLRCSCQAGISVYSSSRLEPLSSMESSFLVHALDCFFCLPKTEWMIIIFLSPWKNWFLLWPQTWLID